jgi:tRNA dimethylallyltransferase
MQKESNKLVIILGPTSSGKSGMAIRLAKKFKGEIISADSRQIYRGMDVGTGKEPGHYDTKNKVYMSGGISHYMIDVVSPKTNFSAAQFKKRTDRIIGNILKRGKLPIICGGTGFWIKAIVDDVAYPEVKPNPILRSALRNKTAEELFAMLQKLDPSRANTIDKNNPVRLIRAIEICKTLGKVPDIYELRNKRKYEILQIGLSLPKEKLHENIKKRLEQRFEAGMIEEVKRLHFKDKISWKRLESFGLGFSLIPKYLRSEIANENELFEKIYHAEKDYAKRQMTWFSAQSRSASGGEKDKRIIWKEKYQEIEKEIGKFLK